MTPPRHVEDAALQSSVHHPVGAGHARPATSPPPAVNLPPPTPPIICARQPRHPNIHLAQTSPSNFVEKIKKTCKNLLTKVILLAIIIKLSREPSPRRQPLEPLPTACTLFFEENFFKKNFRKPLDKRENLIYNIQAVKETRQHSRTLKIEQN